MPQGINRSRQDFRNKLPLHTGYPVIVCYGICCSCPCTIWYLSASENNEKHCSPPALQFLLRALPVFKRWADESMAANSGTGSCVAIPLPQATRHKPPPVWKPPDYWEALGSSEQALLEYGTIPHLATQTQRKSMCFGHCTVRAI